METKALALERFAVDLIGLVVGEEIEQLVGVFRDDGGFPALMQKLRVRHFEAIGRSGLNGNDGALVARDSCEAIDVECGGLAGTV